MPRIANETNALLADLQKRLEKLIDVARREGRDSALEEVRALVGGGIMPRAAKAAKTPAKAAAKPKKKRKNPWANLSPEAKLVRVNAIRIGRGLPAKTADGKIIKTSKGSKSRSRK